MWRSLKFGLIRILLKTRKLIKSPFILLFLGTGDGMGRIIKERRQKNWVSFRKFLNLHLLFRQVIIFIPVVCAVPGIIPGSLHSKTFIPLILCRPIGMLFLVIMTIKEIPRRRSTTPMLTGGGTCRRVIILNLFLSEEILRRPCCWFLLTPLHFYHNIILIRIIMSEGRI